MDEQSLIQEILANPDDDVARLVYADWLDECGDPRGQFIRVQIELASADIDEERHEELMQLETDLRIEHEDQWTADFIHYAHRFVFRRGLLEYIEADLSDFVDNAERLFAKWPITSITLKDARRKVGRLRDCSQLKYIRGLCLDESQINAADVVTLARCEGLSNVTRLMLSRNNLTNEAFVAIAHSDVFSKLAILDVSWNQFGNESCSAIAESQHLQKLESLIAERNSIRLTGARALANSPYLANLEYLDVRHNPLDARGIEVLRNRFGYNACLV